MYKSAIPAERGLPGAVTIGVVAGRLVQSRACFSAVWVDVAVLNVLGPLITDLVLRGRGVRRVETESEKSGGGRRRGSDRGD